MPSSIISSPNISEDGPASPWWTLSVEGLSLFAGVVFLLSKGVSNVAGVFAIKTKIDKYF